MVHISSRTLISDETCGCLHTSQIGTTNYYTADITQLTIFLIDPYKYTDTHSQSAKRNTATIVLQYQLLYLIKYIYLSKGRDDKLWLRLHFISAMHAIGKFLYGSSSYVDHPFIESFPIHLECPTKVILPFLLLITFLRLAY